MPDDNHWVTAATALFMDRVIELRSGCWNWGGTKDPAGYAMLALGTLGLGQHRAARVSYRIFTGIIPKGMTIDHLCRNRECVNPGHLQVVTVSENIMRSNNPAAVNARKTECIRGHPLTTENVYKDPNGKRQCRKCRLVHQKESRKKRQAGQTAEDIMRPARIMGSMHNAHKTHCKRGHPFSEENTGVDRTKKKNGRVGRQCKTCARDQEWLRQNPGKDISQRRLYAYKDGKRVPDKTVGARYGW